MALILISPANLRADNKALFSHIAAKKPRIIAFGEYHPARDYEGKTTLEIFSRDILPILSHLGYKKIILEPLYAGLSVAEYRLYKNNFSHNSTLINDNLLRVKDSQGLKACLDEADRLAVSVYGAWPYGKENSFRVIQIGGRVNPEKLAALEILSFAKMLTLNIISISKQLIMQGDKILIYGGGMHNQCLPEIEALSFGKPFFKKQFGRKYLEVQLMNRPQAEIIPKLVDSSTRIMLKNGISFHLENTRIQHKISLI
jgi:hypothetical protein